MNLTAQNLAVLIPFLVYIAAVVCLAVWARRRTARNIAGGSDFETEYYVSGRQEGATVTMFTFVATAASAGAFIGVPALGYVNGYGILGFIAPLIFMTFLCMVILAKRVSQIARRTGAITLLDILKSRYQSPWVVVTGAIAIIVFYIAYMVAQAVAGALLLSTVTGLPYVACLTLFMATVALYTAFGGFRAVAYTDTLQGFWMAAGILILIPAVIVAGGGVPNITQSMYEIDPELLAPWGAAGILPGVAMLMSAWVLWPVGSMAQPAQAVRYFMFRDSNAAHNVLIWGTLVSVLFFTVIMLAGIWSRPILGDIPQADRAIPTLIISVLPLWIAGLILAAPFAAIMSSVDSYLLVATSSLIRDLFKNYVRSDLPKKVMTTASITVTVLLGATVFLLSLQPPKFLGMIVVYSWAGLAAAFLVPFVAAIYWKRATTAGGIASLVGGFLTYLVVDLTLKHPLGIHTVVWALAASVVGMVLASLLTRPSSRDVLDVFYGVPAYLKRR